MSPDVPTWEQVFYWDIVHPDGQSGHKFMGELVAQLIFDALADVTQRPMTGTRTRVSAVPEERNHSSTAGSR